jgi:hypothetical protein
MRLLSENFFKITMILLCSFMEFTLSGCVTTEGVGMGQAAMTAFETRTIDAPFEQVYVAATEGLFDLGYTIRHTDKNSGVLVGEKKMEKPDAGWMRFSDALGNIVRPESDYYNTFQVTLFIQPAEEQTAKVRIKTAINEQPQLNKKAIDEIWLYIDRQVLMKGGPETKTATAPKKEP